MKENLYAEKLNHVLEESYQLIGRLEESIIRDSNLDLSISEIHVIEVIDEQSLTISEIATRLDITLPSVTIAINKLQKKQYVEKIKNAQDGRSVHVRLTRRGKKINHVHKHFHKRLANNLLEELDETEKDSLLSGLTKLTLFLKKNLK